MTRQLFLFYALFYGALIAGLMLHSWKKSAAVLMRLTILLIDAPLFFYSFWNLNLAQVREYALIPIIALVLIITPLLWLPGRIGRLLPTRAGQGGFIISAAFSNIGTTGGAFVCYLLFGLPGLSLGYLYLLPYPLLIFTWGFALASAYGHAQQPTLREILHNMLTNALSLVPLLAILLGLAANLMGWLPPHTLKPAADVYIKLGLAIQCLAIGMTLKPSQLFSPWQPVAWMAAIKFLALPLMAWLLVWLCYGSWQPLSARVLLVQSAMPPAIYAVITANLFDLDRDLVNALWISNTLLLIPVVAILFFWLG